MSLLYRTMYEYSRVYEEVTLTEEGVYVKDQVPDEYGGSQMNVEIVHRVTMMDMTGYIEELRFENPIPKSKNGNTTSGQVLLDGDEILAGTGGSDPRTWTTRKNDTLTSNQKSLGDFHVALIKKDRETGGGNVL